MLRDESPAVLGFADLFDNIGTDELRYSSRAELLSGRMIIIDGFLAHVHAHGPAPAALMLVDQPGLCPDCAPAPAAVIMVMGARPTSKPNEHGAVRVQGRLDFGFRIDDDVASFIRIEGASIEPVV